MEIILVWARIAILSHNMMELRRCHLYRTRLYLLFLVLEPCLWPKDRHPGPAKREPESQKASALICYDPPGDSSKVHFSANASSVSLSGYEEAINARERGGEAEPGQGIFQMAIRDRREKVMRIAGLGKFSCLFRGLGLDVFARHDPWAA